MKAYEAKDYEAFLTLEKQLRSFAPNDPRTIYNVASGQALTNHPAEAISELDKIVAMHLDFAAEKDPDFASILKTPEWARYEDRVAMLRKPSGSSTVAFSIPEKGLVASSIAVDGTSGDVYIGSLRQRKILKRTKDGVVSEFATSKDGLLGVTSLLVDPVRKQLFAASSAAPFMQGYQKEEEGKAVLEAFDLASGKLIRTAPLFAPGEHHVFAQMVEDQRGDLFIADTGSSEIRRLRRASTEVELFISSVEFHAPRGIALSADDRTLYVVDVATGIWAVDVLSIDRTPITVPPGIFAGGLVGLTRTLDGFVSLQAGVQPVRMVRIHLDAKGQGITAVDTLESNNPNFDGPTPGTISGNILYYIANSQLDMVDKKTLEFPADKGKETVIMRIALEK